MEWTFNNIIMG